MNDFHKIAVFFFFLKNNIFNKNLLNGHLAILKLFASNWSPWFKMLLAREAPEGSYSKVVPKSILIMVQAQQGSKSKFQKKIYQPFFSCNPFFFCWKIFPGASSSRGIKIVLLNKLQNICSSHAKIVFGIPHTFIFTYQKQNDYYFWTQHSNMYI